MVKNGTKHRCMVDIETLGLDHDAVIVSVGAVAFGAGELGETFYRSIDIESCQEAGLTIDASTLNWWFEQDETAQEQLAGGDDLGDVLAEFRGWFVREGFDEIWANSPSFDCTKLKFAGEQIGVDMPWQFYDERDYRTLSSLQVAPNIEQDGTEHDALEDAKHQAHVAAATLRRLDGDDSYAGVSER